MNWGLRFHSRRAWGTRQPVSYDEATGPRGKSFYPGRVASLRAYARAPTAEDMIIEIETLAEVLRAVLRQRPDYVYILYLRCYADLTLLEAGAYLDDFDTEIGRALRVGYTAVHVHWTNLVLRVFEPTEEEIAHWDVVVRDITDQAFWRGGPEAIGKKTEATKKGAATQAERKAWKSMVYQELKRLGRATPEMWKLSAEELEAILEEDVPQADEAAPEDPGGLALQRPEALGEVPDQQAGDDQRGEMDRHGR